jgi:hypothetical protein
VDFIERYLGVSPDGGSGSAEIIFIVLLVVINCCNSVASFRPFQKASFLKLGLEIATAVT